MTTSHQETPQIVLRAIEPEDLDALYMIENNMELWNVGTTNVPYSRYMLHEYVAESAGDIYTDKQVRLMIENDRKEVVGIVDIVEPTDLDAVFLAVNDKARTIVGQFNQFC